MAGAAFCANAGAAQANAFNYTCNVLHFHIIACGKWFIKKDNERGN